MELNMHGFSGRWRMHSYISYGYNIHLAERTPGKYTDYFVTSGSIKYRRKETWFEWKNIKLFLMFLFSPRKQSYARHGMCVGTSVLEGFRVGASMS